MYAMNSPDEIKKIIESDKQKLTIIFDIDGTLAGHASTNEEEKLYFLRKSTLILAAEHEHQVLPGVIELIKLLITKEYINLAFFSSGIKERNTEFVKQLLIRSLGKDKYLELEPSIIILSRDDLTPGDSEKSPLMAQNFGLDWGINKKDIKKALGKDGALTNAIFIDDDATYIYYGQEKNFLRSPRGDGRCFSALKELTRSDEEEYFFRFNTIFYIAGVLSDCIEQFEKKLEVTKLLFNMHFKKSSDTLFGFEQRIDCIKMKEYYEKGLRLLQPVNPTICFVSREDYIRTITLPASDNEQQIIDVSQKMNKANEDCCVM